MSGQTYVAFINTEELPLSIRTICYYTKSNLDTIAVFRVIEETYPHPDAPEDASVTVTKTELVKKYNRYEVHAAYAILLEAAQNNTTEILQKI